MLGAAANQILMRGKAAAALSLKGVIGEHVSLRQLPVRSYLLRIDVLINVRSGRSPDGNGIESVHLAVVIVSPPVQEAVVRRDRAFKIRPRPAGSSCRCASCRRSSRPRPETSRTDYRRCGSLESMITMCVKCLPCFAGGGGGRGPSRGCVEPPPPQPAVMAAPGRRKTKGSERMSDEPGDCMDASLIVPGAGAIPSPAN